MRLKYQSIFGRIFDTAGEAMADEDRLPQVIATYENDLARMVPNGSYAGKVLVEGPELDDLRQSYQTTLDGYRIMWAEVQAQRATNG